MFFSHDIPFTILPVRLNLDGSGFVVREPRVLGTEEASIPSFSFVMQICLAHCLLVMVQREGGHMKLVRRRSDLEFIQPRSLGLLNEAWIRVLAY